MNVGRTATDRVQDRSVLVLGVALLAIPTVRWLATVTAGQPPTATAPEFVLIGGPATVPTVVGWRLLRDDVGSDHRRRVARWTAVGVCSLGFLAVVLIIYPAATIDDPLLALGPAASVGAGAGALVGRSEARTVSRARAAERARLSARTADREREKSAFLNALLRHHVLNAMNVVRGYAALSLETATGEDVPRLETIRDRSDADPR